MRLELPCCVSINVSKLGLPPHTRQIPSDFNMWIFKMEIRKAGESDNLAGILYSTSKISLIPCKRDPQMRKKENGATQETAGAAGWTFFKGIWYIVTDA